ncbi:4-oxalomesaconate tautomerase [Thioalkalivibrio sp. HK1]|uniref:4-oxalomesaconate tautomerase n=1 Tax=Thioalkalivibrio sp. HK1 TaxID=1469245 RepID=UPI00046E5467|nr:4-oxalomesaconate tautomerase [Thioalkalivibrio sp. HK1]
MSQTPIPFLFLRGGTSRGPYFRRSDLPEDRERLTQVLISALGAGHPLNIDGIGGGASVTTKVAMLSSAKEAGYDIDYFFAQVGVDDRSVDYRPTCGNILSGVGPAAIEMGLVEARDETTTVRIRSVNTGARIESLVRTPEGRVVYEGAARIDGVPGSASPVRLSFMDTVGSLTGTLMPTGNVRETIQGIELTCMDVAMPVVMARARDFDLSGHESGEDLNHRPELLAKMESVRIEAGKRMGLGDASHSVVPKFALLAKARSGGTIAARYFTPWKCHPSMAVTSGQCIAACALTPGTVAEDLVAPIRENPAPIRIEHPMGFFDLLMDYERKDRDIRIRSASLLRTARLLARGEILIPRSIWDPKAENSA